MAMSVLKYLSKKRKESKDVGEVVISPLSFCEFFRLMAANLCLTKFETLANHGKVYAVWLIFILRQLKQARSSL
jgi:hypothetical protein